MSECMAAWYFAGFLKMTVSPRPSGRDRRSLEVPPATCPLKSRPRIVKRPRKNSGAGMIPTFYSNASTRRRGSSGCQRRAVEKYCDTPRCPAAQSVGRLLIRASAPLGRWCGDFVGDYLVCVLERLDL